MATKPVKVLSDLLTKKQILKQDSEGNELFKISGSLANGTVSSSLPITASYFVGDGRYLTNVSGSGGIVIVETSGSITGSGTVLNPVTLKDSIYAQSVTASVGFVGNLYGTASYATTSSYLWNNFVHFSSAKERVDNFVYKVQLIERYEQLIISASTDYTNTGGYYLTSIASQQEAERQLIKKNQTQLRN